MVQSSKDESNIKSLQNEVKRLRRECADLQHLLKICNEQTANSYQNRSTLSELSQLIDDVQHDLLNGLGGIRDAIRILKLNALDNDNQTDLDKIQYQVEFCDLALRNLFIFVGKQAFQFGKVNLGTILQELQAILEPKLVDIKWSVIIDEDVTKIVADENQIKLAFMNISKLIGTMIPGGLITFVAKNEYGMTDITIRFTRDKALMSEIMGRDENYFDLELINSDLKLQIARGIIKRHRGTLEINTLYNEGVVISTRFPLD